MIRAAAAALLLLALAACARVDADQARICSAVLPLLMNEGVELRVVRTEPVANAANVLRVDFVAQTADGSETWRSAFCAFGGGVLSRDRTLLVGIALDQGDIGPAQLFFIERFLRERGERVRLVPAPEPERSAQNLAGTFAFLVQALINGLASTGLLALVAAAYALLAGITHRINLAFGDLAVIGGYAALGAFTIAAIGGGSGIAPALAILAAMAVTGLAGRALGQTVVKPLVEEPGRMLLVATIGVSLFVQEFLRLAQGAGQRWLPPVASEAFLVMRGGGFSVTVTGIQLIVAALALAAALALILGLRFTRFGRNWRAVADDPLAARLCGVDPARVLRTTMTLAGALAGLAGVLIALAFGNVHYSAGASLGLKAILAAILGGIGSVGGAMLGGLALGLFEALWSAYLPIVFRDVAVYALLSLVLVTRPDGLFGIAGEAPRTKPR